MNDNTIVIHDTVINIDEFEKNKDKFFSDDYEILLDFFKKYAALETEQEKLDFLKFLNKEKHFNRSNIFYHKAEDRGIRFYQYFNNFYEVFSLIILVASLTINIFAYNSILEKNKLQEVFLTNTIGQSLKYNYDDRKKEIIRQTLEFGKDNK